MLTATEKREHLSGIGSSSAWTCLTAPLDAYLIHTGQAARTRTPEMDLGNFLEDGIAQAWAARHGKTLETRSTLRHPERQWQIAHIDRWVVEDACPLEVKLVGEHNRFDWGEPGTDQIPEMYLVQVTHQMEVLDAPRSHVAALCGSALWSYEVPRDRELGGLITEAEARVWYEHIVPRRPPPPTGSRLVDGWMASRFPVERTPARVAINDEIDAMESLARLRRIRVAAAAEEKAAELRLKELMGDAAGLWLDGVGSVTWRRTKNGQRPFRPSFLGESET
jgi:predicted phage-related endonuclease